jgi:molybdenum cofactor cytidylyltransferase
LMDLQAGFRLKSGEVVAIVGGGGKTTLMFRLAEEIVAAGNRVVTTTTTRIFSAQTSLAPYHLEIENPRSLPRELPELLRVHAHVLITVVPENGCGKAPGIAPELVLEIKELVDTSKFNMVVEADGSRMRSLKAPESHEPVIPDCSTLVAPIVGADIFGELLTDENVHRAHIAADLLGAGIGDLVTPDLVARLLLHPQGGAKDLPTGARLVPVINKVETQARLHLARETARVLLCGGADEVLLGATASANPVIERWGRVAIILLAAGGATRMGEAGEIKQLLPWGRGTLLTRAVDVALQSEADSVVVVVGCQSERVEDALGSRNVTVVHNPDWKAGQSGSVRVGLDALEDDVTGAIFLLVDQPCVGTELLDAVIQAYRQSGTAIVAPRAGGRYANPVLFDNALWADMRQVQGDKGGRELLDLYANRITCVDWGDEILAEVNTGDDYLLLRENISGN